MCLRGHTKVPGTPPLPQGTPQSPGGPRGPVTRSQGEVTALMVPYPPRCRRNKVLNHFSIMQQRRLRDQDEEEEEEKGPKAPRKGGDLKIHDLEDDLELSSEESEGSEAEGGWRGGRRVGLRGLGWR